MDNIITEKINPVDNINNKLFEIERKLNFKIKELIDFYEKKYEELEGYCKNLESRLNKLE